MTGPDAAKQVWCSACDGFQPVVEEQPHSDNLNEHSWADVVCGTCRLVLLTFRWKP